METALTKEIKILTHTYKPQMGYKTESKKNGRTIRYADEVCTPTGIVDSIRFEDYVTSRREDCLLVNYDSLTPELKYHADRVLDNKSWRTGCCKIEGETYPNSNCKGCFMLKRGIPEIGMMITAYDVKITKADFKSSHGHNIDDPEHPIANENYYCMPKELIPEVENMIPEHAGILAYKNGKLKKYRQAKFLEISEETKCLMLYNALKKWCDAALKNL